jgi:Zierdtviridae DNA polymerase
VEFVSFHTHTTHSHGDGHGTVPQHVARVAELGMTAMGVSEHGNVNSHAALEQECRKAGIKPIFGIEAYMSKPDETRKFHITLFAMNEEGYRNLNRIVTQSWIDFKQYPTVTWESLRKYNAGIVAFSGCADSLISCTLLGGKSLGEKRTVFTERDFIRCSRKVQRFADVFEDRFYLEVQRFPGLERTCALNPAFATISNDTGIPLIATADVHYPLPEQNQIQKVLHAARRKSSVAVAEAQWEYDILLTYPQSDQELLHDLQATGLSEPESLQALHNTRRLAEQISVSLPKARPLRYAVPPRSTAQGYFKKMVAQGLEYRKVQRPNIVDQIDKYRERINLEYQVIRDKNFCDYFLATAELVAWAKDQGIAVGPGRGSAVSSLICYLLRITEIDPLTPPFDKVIFERFIDPTRSDPPDIDLDFDDERRKEVEAKAREIYGDQNVANVANHIGYRGKNSLDGVARAHALPLSTFKPIKERIADRTETDERVDDTIADVLESYASNPEIADLAEKFPDQLATAMAFEGNEHSMGIHAGGFVIATDPIPDVCAIYTRTKGSGRNRQRAQVIPYDKRDAEYLNMLKMDFLGLTTMGMIGKCIEWAGLNLEELYQLFYAAPESEHQRILEMFCADDITGIFQYEGGTTRQVTRLVQPATFHELAACNALSRPGPYYGGQTEAYIAVKHGNAEMLSVHENFDQHVEWTYGQIVYQEQIMRILRDVAGFDVPRVLRVRKIIGKKLGEHQFTALWDEFRTGCETNSGLSEDDAARIWGAITTAAGYAFNIPHAYSYALIAWWQAYLKCHNKVEFFASSLAKNGDGKDDLPRRTALLKDALSNRLQVNGFSVTGCRENWRPVQPKGLQPGFAQMPGIGEAMASDLTAWIDHLPFAQWPEDGLTWKELARKKTEGGCDGIGEVTATRLEEFANQRDPLGISRTEDQLMAFRKQLVRREFDSTGIPSADEFYTSASLPDDNDWVAFVGLVANVVYRDEVETIRSRTGQTADEIRAGLDDADKTKKATVFAYDEFGEVALRISRWQLPKLADRLAQIKTDYHLVVAWGRTFENRSGAIQIRNLWVFDPD